MSDEYKTYNTATLAFQKLDTQPGDVVVITFPADIEPVQMQTFGAELQPHIPDDVAILCTREGVAIETLSETQMNKMGWYKFDNDKSKAN